MRKLIVLLAAGALLLGCVAPALACYRGDTREVSLKRAEKVAKLSHEVFTNPRVAHRWQGRISCESKFRKYARNGEYWGLAQMGRDERRACNWGWDILKQLKAAKCWWKEHNGTWSCALS